MAIGEDQVEVEAGEDQVAREEAETAGDILIAEREEVEVVGIAAREEGKQAEVKEIGEVEPHPMVERVAMTTIEGAMEEQVGLPRVEVREAEAGKGHAEAMEIQTEGKGRGKDLEERAEWMVDLEGKVEAKVIDLIENFIFLASVPQQQSTWQFDLTLAAKVEFDLSRCMIGYSNSEAI